MNAIKLNYTALANTARECAQLANGVSGTMKWIVAHWNLCCQQSDLLTFTTEARYTRRAALAADMLRMAEQLDRLANDCDAITGEPVEALIVSASNEDVQTTEALNQPEEITMNTTFENVVNAIRNGEAQHITLHMSPEAKADFVRDFPKFFAATIRYFFGKRGDVAGLENEQISALAACIALAANNETGVAVACANVASALTATSFERTIESLYELVADAAVEQQA